MARTGIQNFMGASSGFGVGLGYHPFLVGGAESCVPSDYTTPTVAFGLLPGVAAAINNSLAATTPTSLSTPPPGLQGALTYAKNFATANPTHKVGLVLIADSLPNTCSFTAVATDLANVAATYWAGTPQVRTYVLAIGNDVVASSWNQIAAAGGTTTAYAANSAPEVQAALTSMRDKLKACP